MAYINIPYETLEKLYSISLQDRKIIDVKKHPMLGRTLMLVFISDEELKIPTVDELVNYPVVACNKDE